MAQVSNPLVEAAGWNGGIGNVAQPGLLDGLPLSRLVILEPPLLARNVIRDVGESQRLEPPRGPRGKVSTEIVAVDDYRPLSIEPAGGLARQRFQRNIDGTGEMAVLEIVRIQDVDQLRALVEQPPNLADPKEL